MQQRLRVLGEAECYARCYAAKTDTVRVIALPSRRVRRELSISGELMRRQFESLLDSRAPDAVAEPEAA